MELATMAAIMETAYYVVVTLAVLSTALAITLIIKTLKNKL